jgi:hypothetical protein
VTAPELSRSGSWLARAVAAGLERVRRNAILAPGVAQEELRERAGGHPVERSHRPHLRSALEWLARAQDATREGGVARGYSLAWNAEFRSRGWQPAYPETTGLVAAVWFQAARHLSEPALAARGARAAGWTLDVQRERGVLRSGVITRPISPAVFHTGAVVLGWLSAYRHTAEGIFASAARRGATYLVAALQGQGLHRYGDRRWIHLDDTLLRARAAWVLAEVGQALEAPEFTVAAARQLREVAAKQTADGWFTEPAELDRRPVLHELAGAVRGLLEGAALLQDEVLLRHAADAAAGVSAALRPNGRLAGRFGDGWEPATRWSCLSGQAQMATVWLRLFELTGERRWLDAAATVLRFLKSTQNRSAAEPGLRGGIKGSFPITGPYGQFQTLNWATALFAEALMQHERVATGRAVVQAVCSATATTAALAVMCEGRD